jgi:hypothetical protein
MFNTIDQLNNVFKRYDDGTIASIIECNRDLLTNLVLAAAGNNFWLSKYAINILILGVDTIQTGEDIPYLELITVTDWIRLLNGKYSENLPQQHLNYMHGWLLDLLLLTKGDLDQLLTFLSNWMNNKIAIITAANHHMDQIILLVPQFDLSIWQYLVQIPNGKQLVIDSIDKYSRIDQKKIITYLQTYG